jgi:shikimate dehydrogenase
VLGAGGAARAAVVGLARAGAARVTIAARKASRAEALVADLGPVLGTPLDAVALDDVAARFAETTLLVQATSATLEGRNEAVPFAAALPFESLPKTASVVDLVYAPRETTVLRAAAHHGLRTIDGFGMLLHQGALAFERWLGVAPPLDVMRRALV